MDRRICGSRIRGISGPVIQAEASPEVRMYEVVRVGDLHLMGEVVRLRGKGADIQVYEDTTGLSVGENVDYSGKLLSVDLGPGLLGGVFDGIGRPLDKFPQGELFLPRGVALPSLDEEKLWEFIPRAELGQILRKGDIFGVVREGARFEHRLMVPPNFEGGELEEILSPGSYRVGEPLGRLSSGETLRMKQSWNIRTPRPVKAMLPLDEPLLTGQRVLDSLFPMAKGGAAIIPGGFGTGKTVTQQSLAKWCDADVIIYIGCGERGNEMTEVLEEFPELRDPRYGTPLMERVMLIANTSNMPVAAREASIYVGITAAEYFRDMGYSVALMADSTSRWAEALREISGRLEEMPGEEGYPAYLGARLAAFFERAGKARLLGGENQERIGSVSVVNAVSPAGGDFSEPVTQASLRMAGAFWALDKKLAQERHFPSINWRTSYSLYTEGLEPYFSQRFGKAWRERVQFMQDLLAKEKELSDLVQLLGRDGLGEEDKWILEIAHLIRVVFLQQNAFDDQDAYSSLFRQRQMLELFQGLYERGKAYLEEGFFFENLPVTSLRRELLELRREPEESLEKGVQVWLAHFSSDLESLKEAIVRG